jgi:hypothetical protein
MNYNDYSITAINDPNFDIFDMVETIGKDNVLSTITCYVFIQLGLYCLINYEYFENFIDVVQKGYNKNNPYHNDIHAADVEQTCFVYYRYANLRDVNNFYLEFTFK